MNHLRSAAISTGPDTHLDHLSPICALMNIPLIVLDEKNALLAKEFYPQIEIQSMEPQELSLDFLASQLDVIYECGKFWALELLPLLQLLYQKKMRIVFCPHGNSDKETAVFYKQGEFFQDISLIYGKQMREVMKRNQALKTVNHLIEIGNVRRSFYLHHKNHFDQIAQKTIFSHLDPRKKTLLYAPTWHTKESPSSFFKHCSHLIDQLSIDYNLIVKLHPLLEESHPAETFYVMEKYKEKKSPAFFLKEFPAIYCLLEKIDLYMGDFSSIGYDFLIYDRPMIFLNPRDKKSPLHQCGQCVEETKNADLKKIIQSTLENGQKHLSETRKKFYFEAFGKLQDFDQLGKKLKNKLHKSLL